MSHIPGGKFWTVDAPLVYRTRAGEKIEVPPTFITDFTSGPRLLWPLIPVQGKHTEAAVLHDYTLSSPLFLEALRDGCAVSWITRYVMWLGVLIYGQLPWVKARRARRQVGAREAATV